GVLGLPVCDSPLCKSTYLLLEIVSQESAVEENITAKVESIPLSSEFGSQRSGSLRHGRGRSSGWSRTADRSGAAPDRRSPGPCRVHGGRAAPRRGRTASPASAPRSSASGSP